MADPLTIMTSVITLLSYCGNLIVQIKLLSQTTEAISATIDGLLKDGESFDTVLQAMHEIFSQPKYQPVMSATGHLGSHWKDIFQCIDGGRKWLASFTSFSKSSAVRSRCSTRLANTSG